MAVLVQGVEPASFSWDVYSRQPANTVTLRKARSKGIQCVESPSSILSRCYGNTAVVLSAVVHITPRKRSVLPVPPGGVWCVWCLGDASNLCEVILEWHRHEAWQDTGVGGSPNLLPQCFKCSLVVFVSLTSLR